MPFEHAEAEDRGIVVLVESVASGANVDRQGSVAAIGELLTAGTRLMPHHIGF